MLDNSLATAERKLQAWEKGVGVMSNLEAILVFFFA